MFAYALFKSWCMRRMAAIRHRRHIMEVSLRVREESMGVNAEFDAIEDAPNA